MGRPVSALGFAAPVFGYLEAASSDHHLLLNADRAPLILFRTHCNPKRPALHSHWTDRDTEAQKVKPPRVWGP